MVRNARAGRPAATVRGRRPRRRKFAGNANMGQSGRVWPLRRAREGQCSARPTMVLCRARAESAGPRQGVKFVPGMNFGDWAGLGRSFCAVVFPGVPRRSPPSPVLLGVLGVSTYL